MTTPSALQAICPRCKDPQFTKVRDSLTVFQAHAAKGTSPRMWCRESGQPVDAAELERVRAAVESLAQGPRRTGANDGVAADVMSPGAPSLLQAMVDALRGVDGDLAARLEGAAIMLNGKMGFETEVGGLLEEEAKSIRAALDAWGKRPSLRDQPDATHIVFKKLVEVAFREPRRASGHDVEEILDALDALLFGERG